MGERGVGGGVVMGSPGVGFRLEGAGWEGLMVRALRAVSIIDWGGCCGASSGVGATGNE